MCGKKQKWGQGRLVFHCQPGVLPKIQQYTECRRVCPLLKGMIQLPVQWKQAEIPKIFPIILSPHLLHSAAPCHALLPQQDTATSTGLSRQVPEGVFMHRDKQSPSHSEATGKMLQCQEECCNYMAQIGLRMKTLNLKWDDPIECRCVWVFIET